MNTRFFVLNQTIYVAWSMGKIILGRSMGAPFTDKWFEILNIPSEAIEIDIFPGIRVFAFDSLLFKNDKITPLTMTMKPGMIINRYGQRDLSCQWKYPDLVDIQFDHRLDSISRGHFTDGIIPIIEKELL